MFHAETHSKTVHHCCTRWEMITLLSSGVGYKNHYLSLSLVLWTFPNNELNHSHMQKRIRKSILWKSEAQTGQKCTLNVKLHLAHWKGNPPDKTTGSRVQRLRTPVRGDTKDNWAASSLSQQLCQVCLRAQCGLFARRMCCESLHLKDTMRR